MLTQAELQQVFAAIQAVGSIQPPPYMIGSQFTLRQTVFGSATVGLAATIQGNANRVMMIVAVPSGCVAWLSLTPQVAPGYGISIVGSTGPLILQIGDHGSYPQQAFYFLVQTAGTGNATAIEMIWQPPS
jgi:hypothetical protein